MKTHRLLWISTLVTLFTFSFVACGGGDSGPNSEPVNPTPIPSKVTVTGVTLNKTNLSLVEGGTETLSATVTPSNATNKNVTWSSSDTSIAKVDSNGKITAVAAGTATITVTTADGNKKATCTVTVKEDNLQGNASHEGFN